MNYTNLNRTVRSLARRDYFKEKRGPVAQVYNAGVIEFYSKQDLEDDYGTVIGSVDTLTYEDWYRKLGITSEDVYYAHSDNKELTRKVAIRGDVEIDTKWSARIEEKQFEVYRTFYAYKNNELEISLVEVG